MVSTSIRRTIATGAAALLVFGGALTAPAAGAQTITGELPDYGGFTVELNGGQPMNDSGALAAITIDALRAGQPISVDMQQLATQTLLPMVTSQLPAGVVIRSVTIDSVAGLPAGLSFDKATQTISGTPAAAGHSQISITATVTGSYSFISRTITQTVNGQLTVLEADGTRPDGGDVVVAPGGQDLGEIGGDTDPGTGGGTGPGTDTGGAGGSLGSATGSLDSVGGSLNTASLGS